MAEIDTRPLDSVREAVTLFEPRSDRLNRFSPDRNDQQEAVDILTQELATCKLQLEVKENETKQAILKTEALHKAMQELSDKYDRACLDSHGRIAQLEAENSTIRSRQSETADECKALRDELAIVKGELSAAKASIAYALKEVEMMEARAILERDSTKEALMRILQLNETVLSSAVAAIRAEEERSVFFQEVTLELFNCDNNLQVIRRQMEMMGGMEKELLAKTVEIEYLRSELNQAKENYISSQDVSGATSGICGCKILKVHVCGTSAVNQEPEAEFTFQHAPEERFVSDEIFRKDDCLVVPSDGLLKMSEDAVEDEQRAEVTVQDTTVREGNSDAQETQRLVDQISGKDNVAFQQGGKNMDAEHKDGDVNLRHDHDEPKVDASFVLDSSKDDFQSVHSDGKDISMPEQNQEPVAVAAASTPTPREGNSSTCVVATEAVTNDADEFYTKELDPGQGAKPKLDGYVLIAKSAEADAGKDKALDAARAEISDLRFSLEEAVRRAELAEEAKAALERELREEIRNKHPSRRRAKSDSEDARRPAREGLPPPTPARPRPTPPRSARPGGEEMPTPRCVTLGKMLNMKYK